MLSSQGARRVGASVVDRKELEHAIRAVCDVTGDTEVYVFGSQAILGQFPNAPDALRQSAEADIAPVHAVGMSTVIDAHIGELSQFHQTHGFYVQGVDIDTPVLPTGWQRRAIKVKNPNTNDRTGWCLEVHDLAVSKLAAFRDKDRDFVRVLIAEDLINARTLLLRISQLPTSDRVPAGLRSVVGDWVKGIVKDLLRG